MRDLIEQVYKHGKFRKAVKKESKCADCWTVIKIGEKYFDTCERDDAPFATIKLCMLCIDEDRKDGRFNREWFERKKANGYKGL